MTTGHLGMRRSDEARSRMSAAHLDKKHSPETIEKLRAAAIEQHHGVARHPCHGLTRGQREAFDAIVTASPAAADIRTITLIKLVEAGLIDCEIERRRNWRHRPNRGSPMVKPEARQQWLRWRGRVKR